MSTTVAKKSYSLFAETLILSLCPNPRKPSGQSVERKVLGRQNSIAVILQAPPQPLLKRNSQQLGTQ